MSYRASKFNVITLLGAISIEKIPKISASVRNFLDTLPSTSKKGSTNEDISFWYLIVIIKFVFFLKFQNPLSTISPEDRTSPIFTIEVAPNSLPS